jgi:hypothetical protein
MKFFSLLILSVLSLNVFAHNPTISEEYYVIGQHPELLKELSLHPDLVVDHADSNGFEIYGPNGLSKFLSDKNINFYSLKETSKNVDWTSYPNYQQITQKLQEFAQKYPQIVKLFSVGKSVQGRDLWMLKISDNVNVDEVEPEFKFISSMHGDEITGRELTIRLIDEMLKSYGSDQRITDLINNTEIFIMPSMNPDGSEMRRRANANGSDLNRDFPEFVRNDSNTPQGRQPETQAIMNFQKDRNFALSANFHGGAVCVNYPWDARYDAHPFESLVKDFSQAYADLNTPMRNSREFAGGITNGARWYVLRGGMQDWSSVWHNDLQVTIELSNSKWPSYSQIPNFYLENKDSMLKYIELVHQGAGIKLSDKSAEGVVAIKNQAGRSLGSYGFQNGEFYKVLDFGSYVFDVKTKVNGREFTKSVSVVVDDNIRENGNFISL